MSEKRKLEIAIITPYRHYYGGVEIVNEQLNKALSDHNITFITLDNVVPVTVNQKIRCAIFGFVGLIKKVFQDQDKQFDLVICNGEFGFGIDHPNAINLFHGSAYGYRKAKASYIGFRERIDLIKTSLAQALAVKNKYVVCVSNYVKKVLSNQGIEVHRVIHNCVDQEIFCPMPNCHRNNRILFVGAMDYYGKGIDILSELSEMGLQIDCVCENKPPSNLGWISCRNNYELVDLYREYDLMIFPSRFEGMSMVVLEAMACGLPVIISNVGIADELRRKIPEFVVDELESSEYFKRVEIILKEREEFSKKAVQYITTYHSFITFREQWYSLVNDLVKSEKTYLVDA